MCKITRRRQAAPTAASRVQCDMCRTPFRLEVEEPEFCAVFGPLAAQTGRIVGAVIAFEILTLLCGYFINMLAYLTGARHWPHRGRCPTIGMLPG